jgi:hypothetical protein
MFWHRLSICQQSRVSTQTLYLSTISLTSTPSVHPPLSLSSDPRSISLRSRSLTLLGIASDQQETLASEDAVGKLMRWPPDLIQDLKIWGMPIGQAKNVRLVFLVLCSLQLSVTDAHSPWRVCRASLSPFRDCSRWTSRTSCTMPKARAARTRSGSLVCLASLFTT